MANEIKTTMYTQATTEVWATEENDFIFDGEKCIIGTKNPNVTHIKFPEGTIRIGNDFYDELDDTYGNEFGSKIEYIYIPKSVKHIYTGAFINKQLLKTIDFAEKADLSYIDKYAFEGTAIETLHLPDDVECDQKAFANCKNLHTLILPKNATYVEDNVYTGCVSLKNVIWPKSLEDIGHYSFMGTALEVLDLRQCTNLYYISAYAFAKCESLHTIIFPANKNITLKSFAFANCTALQYIDKPPITKLITCPETFEGCYKLTTTEDEGTSKKDAADAYLMRRGILL